jgi:hypothetical protein
MKLTTLPESANAPHPRNFHSTVYHNNTLIVFAGKANGYKNDMHQFDLSNREWAEIDFKSEHCPTPRYGHTADVLNSVMYVLGGYDNKGTCSKELYRYDLNTKVWLEPINIGVPPRFHHTSTLDISNGNLYIFGGCNERRQCFDDLYRVDLNTLICEKLEPPNDDEKPAPRFGHVSYFSEDKVYVFGGCDYKGNDFDQNGHVFNLVLMSYEVVNDYKPLTTGACFATVNNCAGKGAFFYGGVVKNPKITSTSVAPASTGKIRTPLYYYIEEFSDDIILSILRYCDLTTLCALECVSKSWKVGSLSRSNLLWENIYDKNIIKQPTWNYPYLQMIEKDEVLKKNINKILADKDSVTGHSYKRAIIKLSKYRGISAECQKYYIGTEKLFSMQTKGNYSVKCVIVGDGATGK